MNPSKDITGNDLAGMLNDSNIDRIMAIDKDWCIIAWNKTSELVSAIKKEAVINKKLLDVFPLFAQDKELLNAIELAMSGIRSFVPAYKDLFNRQHYENHFIPLKDKDGNLVGVMNIMHDVSHRIKAEQQLYQLNIALKKKYEQLERANDELANITYITSHNIKDPLRQVYSSLELLIHAEAKALSDGGKANLRRMQGSLNRMNLLLDDMLALSGISHPAEEGTLVDLNKVCEQATGNLAEKITLNNVQVEVGDLPAVTGHMDLLYYLFFHLINNAARFGRHNTPLQLSIKGNEVEFSGSDDAFIKISFTDNGTGFNQEDAERIFQITEKAPQKYASSGAALAICRKIMIVHEGYIQAEGTPGKGATFHCYFPKP